MTQGSGWLSVGEAAAAAGVSRQAVYGWIGRGHLRAVPAGGSYRIAAAELARVCTARRAAAANGLRLETVLHWTAEAPADGGG